MRTAAAWAGGHAGDGDEAGCVRTRLGLRSGKKTAKFFLGQISGWAQDYLDYLLGS